MDLDIRGGREYSRGIRSRRAYQLGVDVLKAKREGIPFVAFAGWDAAGANLFGHPTY
jgi:hypothetical protein